MYNKYLLLFLTHLTPSKYYIKMKLDTLVKGFLTHTVLCILVKGFPHTYSTTYSGKGFPHICTVLCICYTRKISFKVSVSFPRRELTFV